MGIDSSTEESRLVERYKFTISYNGTAFFGFQRQGETRTVQLELENALRKLGWKEESIVGAGRTDSGVHASGQVVSAAMEWHHGEEQRRTFMPGLTPCQGPITTTSIFHRSGCRSGMIFPGGSGQSQTLKT